MLWGGMLSFQSSPDNCWANNSALCVQGLTQDTGRGSQEESSCSSCCPVQFHPLCSAAREMELPKPPLELGGLCLCPPPVKRQTSVLHGLAFPASHFLLGTSCYWDGSRGRWFSSTRDSCSVLVLRPIPSALLAYNQQVTAAFKCKSIGLFFKIVTAGRFFSSRLFLPLKKKNKCHYLRTNECLQSCLSRR